VILVNVSDRSSDGVTSLDITRPLPVNIDLARVYPAIARLY